MQAVRAHAFAPVLVFALALGGACSSSSGSSQGGGARPDEGADGPGAGPGDGRDSGGQPGNGAPGTSVTPAYLARDVNHVLGTGQSLSLGAMGTPALSRAQPFANVMFDTGLVPADRSPTAFVPLAETSTFLGQSVETPSSSLANLASHLFAARFRMPQQVLVSLHGESGASYPMIRRGTQAYTNGLAQVRTAKSIAESSGKSYVVRAITVVHGESDGWNNWNDEYARALLEWQAHYDADIKDITGQAEDVPMFHSQYSAWSPVEPTPTSIIPGLQLAAHLAAPGRVVLVGPKYMLPYASDGLHLTNEGYRRLGEYYAKAYVRHVLEGGRWEPLRPRQITRDGSVVRIAFVVPAPPLVLDTTAVTDPGDFGFEIDDDAGTEITSVAVTSSDTVTIQLSGEPRGERKRIRYAWTAVPGQVAGAATGPRGNLRDSDATPSRHGYALSNWCVHFDEPLP